MERNKRLAVAAAAALSLCRVRELHVDYVWKGDGECGIETTELSGSIVDLLGQMRSLTTLKFLQVAVPHNLDFALAAAISCPAGA